MKTLKHITPLFERVAAEPAVSAARGPGTVTSISEARGVRGAGNEQGIVASLDSETCRHYVSDVGKDLREFDGWMYIIETLRKHGLGDAVKRNPLEAIDLFLRLLPNELSDSDDDMNRLAVVLSSGCLRPFMAVERPVAQNADYKPRSNAKAGGGGGRKISDIVREYCAELKSGNNWSSKTEEANLAIFRLFTRIVGDRNIDEVSHEDFRRYKKVVQELPANYSKKFKGMSIDDIVALPNQRPMAPRTINKYLERIGSLFRFAKNNHYVAEDVTAGNTRIRFKDHERKKRLSYTNEELRRIFLSREYLSGEAKKCSYQFWLPLLGAFTGARINELCQLYLGDIRPHKDGFWTISFNEDGVDKRLKNSASSRIIPIHQQLIDLGFLNLVEQLRRRGEIRLFPQLKLGRDGYGAMASKWFGRQKRRWGFERGKDFHSFRHTVSNHLKQKGVMESKVQALLGHDSNSMTYGNYASPYSARAIVDAVQQIDYEIDFSPLMHPKINPYVGVQAAKISGFFVDHEVSTK